MAHRSIRRPRWAQVRYAPDAPFDTALDWTCPHCSAAPGQPCEIRSGRPYPKGSHRARLNELGDT